MVKESKREISPWQSFIEDDPDIRRAFGRAKHVAFSMGRVADQVKQVLMQEFQALRQLPQTGRDAPYASIGEAADWIAHRNDYPTDQCTDALGYRSSFSFVVEAENQLHFETHQDGFEGVELLGIPIEKEDTNGLIHVLKTWEKTKSVLKKKHKKAQILTFCL